MARMWEGASSARVVMIVGGVDCADEWCLVVDDTCDDDSALIMVVVVRWNDGMMFLWRSANAD